MATTNTIPTTAITSAQAKRIVMLIADGCEKFTIRAHQQHRTNVGATHHVVSHELVLHFMRQHSGTTMYTFHMNNSDVTSTLVECINAIVTQQQ